MSTGYVYDPIYLKHDTGGHVENIQRLKSIMSRLEQSGLTEQLTLIKPRAATIEELMLVHNQSLITQVQDTAKRGGGWLDPDTVVSPDSYDAALYAAGGSIKAVEAVMDGEVSSAFALVRPPGHHATPNRAMGFCLFNNIAIAAKYAQKKYGLERALIIDFDVHHGNGTQDAFYEDPQVMYISTHEYPHYPGTGNVEETGIGEGKGTTVNIPLPANTGDTEYLEAFRQVIIPATKKFKPQIILVSFGADIHREDMLAFMQVTVTGIAQMVKIIKELAEELCEGKLVFTLEGGYNLEALAVSVKAIFDVLLGNNIEDTLGQPSGRSSASGIDALISRIKEIHSLS